jgi:Tfp pilus assembly protein PilO
MGESDSVLHLRPRIQTHSPERATRPIGTFKTILFGLAISVLVTGCKPAEPAKSNENAVPDATQAQIAERRKSIDEVTGQIAALQAKFPAQTDVDGIFQEVRGLLDKNRLEISKKTASESAENALPYYTQVARAAQVTGSFPSIQTFFRDVAAMEKPVAISNVVLERANDRQGSLETSFTITAFYLTDANRQPAQVVSAASPDQEVAALDEQLKSLRERQKALADLTSAQRAPSAVLDLLVAKLPQSRELRLDTVKLQNDSMTVSGVTTKEDLVTEFGRALQSDPTGVLQDISFRAEKKSAPEAANTNGNSNENTNAAPTDESQELGFNVTAKYVPSRLSPPTK